MRRHQQFLPKVRINGKPSKAKPSCLQTFTAAIAILASSRPIRAPFLRVANSGSRESGLATNSLILCIDDEVLGLQIRKVVLERAGYQVLTAADGESGLNLFEKYAVDAVILDYFMPGMNGGEVAVQMRRARANVPIVLLSAYIDLPTDVVRSVDSILMKGDGPGILMEKVQELLASPGYEGKGR